MSSNQINHCNDFVLLNILTDYINGIHDELGVGGRHWVWVGARTSLPGNGRQEYARWRWGSRDNMQLPYLWHGRYGDCLQVRPADNYPLVAYSCSKARSPYVCEYEP